MNQAVLIPDLNPSQIDMTAFEVALSELGAIAETITALSLTKGSSEQVTAQMLGWFSDRLNAIHAGLRTRFEEADAVRRCI